MRHQQIKLSACGQEVGGDMLFSKRLGFSGTPSDLLPEELGRCGYEKGLFLVQLLSYAHVLYCSLWHLIRVFLIHAWYSS